MPSVMDVAEFILKETGTLTTLKLQKLVYYCQAWSLVWDDAPLFGERIEAWANGPVVRELFNIHRGMYLISSIPGGNPDRLSEPQKETIRAVVDYYGPKSSQWLSDLTHMESPWVEARKGIPPGEHGAKTITHSSMADYYSSLAPNSE